jgi:hypothetical protein
MRLEKAGDDDLILKCVSEFVVAPASNFFQCANTQSASVLDTPTPPAPDVRLDVGKLTMLETSKASWSLSYAVWKPVQM